MTNVLKNSKGIEIQPRPTLNDSEIKKLVIRNAVDALFSDKYCPFEDHEKQDLINSLDTHYYQHIDEYDLAKYFEDDSWDVDRDFVTNLEQVTGYLDQALRDSEKSWADLHQPIPPFEIGTRLKFLDVRGVEYGSIDSIYEYSPAYYTVKVDGTTENDSRRRLIRFEDARPQVLSIGDLVEPIKADYQLASGCSRYDNAVVISTDPFVLTSRLADMRWQSTVKPDHFRIVGKVEGEELEICMERLEVTND
ncbi:hypothetical protein [Vibrio sp. TBV020]|uniref:hypothetical protein n=1 Tax=Vibrio sp. TBV020 TaxID=3137398 RepID=UPI0038CDBBCC